jgi:hypothetical protein
MMEMIVSDDINWKKGGLLSIITLMAADCKDQESVSPRATRYSNLLRKLNTGPDTIIQEVAARAIGMCAIANQTLKQEYVDCEIRRAIEWIGVEDQRGTKGDRQVRKMEMNIARTMISHLLFRNKE